MSVYLKKEPRSSGIIGRHSTINIICGVLICWFFWFALDFCGYRQIGRTAQVGITDYISGNCIGSETLILNLGMDFSMLIQL